MTDETTNNDPDTEGEIPTPKETDAKLPKEIGGQKGPEPTRYGDWEKGGIISDF